MVVVAGARPFLSVIVPVYNGGEAFVECLQALTRSGFKDWELIVVNDGSQDRSAAVATAFGATLLHTGGRVGPGAARNQGAKVAQGEYLCFIDADCEVHPDTLGNLAEVLRQRPEVEAVFGSYDDAPKAPNFVAQFKNLMHHYVHQRSAERSTSFWAGCGAVRRSTFFALGGFDTARYPRPCIEDIDLGYRLAQRGGQILLAKHVQVKHHKAWTLKSLIKTDILDRGVPWTRLLLANGSGLANDLNLSLSSRLSVVMVFALIAVGMASIVNPHLLGLVLLGIGVLLGLNWEIYVFFYHKRGSFFALQSIGMHWLYYFYSGLAFILGHIWHWQSAWKSETAHRLRVYLSSILPPTYRPYFPKIYTTP